MKRRHAKTLALIFRRPTSGNVRFADVLALLVELGATVETSRAVAAVRDWLQQHEVTP